LPNWRTGLKQINISIQNLTRCVTSNKYIYINLNIGYGNETIKFVITTKFLGVKLITQPDSNIGSVCIQRCSSACFGMVAVTGLMTTDTLYFLFTMPF